MNVWSGKYPLLLAEGPRKEGSYPGPTHLAALLVSVGRAAAQALYLSRATGN